MRPTCKQVTATGFICGHTIPCPFHPATAFEEEHHPACRCPRRCKPRHKAGVRNGAEGAPMVVVNGPQPLRPRPSDGQER